MEPGALLLLLCLLIVVVTWLVRPFVEGPWREGADDQALSLLKDEHERLLDALQELDFDARLGKIPEEEYPSQRNDLLQKGAAVLKQIDDASHSLTPMRKGSRNQGNASPKQQGRGISGKQKTSSSRLKVSEDDPIEELIAARRASRKGKSAGFCPQCGRLILTSDQFCHACGHRLK